MSKKNVILGVSGSIAAYKAAELASQLHKKGASVHVILTENALQFIQPMTFTAITHNPVVTSLWDEKYLNQPPHLQLAEQAHLALLAPATAHLIAQMAHGLAPDALTTTLLAVQCPVLIAPAMNGNMWFHQATQANVQTLKSRGIEFIGPDEGLLACGYMGIGRLWPVEQITSRACEILDI